MDAKVNDFFNEINEIAPQKSPKEECVWKECFDELTGYAYYWNTKTDVVTWTVPPGYKSQKKTKTSEKSKKPSIYVPPRAAPPFPSSSTKVPEESVKIYSIGITKKDGSSKTSEQKNEKVKPPKRLYRPDSDSEDEKITIISSYGEDSESDNEGPDYKKSKNEINLSKQDSYISEEEDDIDILTKIQKRAKELKELGGDLPPEVAKITNIPKIEPLPVEEKKKKNIGGFSLVAGYSDSDEENDEIRAAFASKPQPLQVAHSTLFPITKPIDIKDFMQPKVEEPKVSTSSDFDSKAFQRKRRIGIALVNTVKKKEEESDDNIENGRKGFGFSNDTNLSETDNIYPGFNKGGMMFVKTDILNPSLHKVEETNCDKKEKIDEKGISREDVEFMYGTLVEKLGFLNGGRPVVPPAQVMVIQAETLFMAMNDGGLKLPYFQKWLNETCAELIKLEKEATPDGWLLQWDRSNKRYYYQNRVTGVSQWEYPQPDTDRCDDAMDISTTPPPDQVIRMSPPLPPLIRSPTPPPPPIISHYEEYEEEKVELVFPDVPLPPDLNPPRKFVNNGEPLPPGVDMPELVYNKSKKQEVKTTDPLHSALDSFYSDIAAIDSPTPTSPQPPLPPEMENIADNFFIETNLDVKKKKKKVKLAPGLSLKKKGVSQLVEKWKNVQQQFND